MRVRTFFRRSPLEPLQAGDRTVPASDWRDVMSEPRNPMSEPRRYRTRPVTVEAMGPLSEDNYQAIARWCGGRAHADVKPSDHDDVAYYVDVPNLDGPQRAWNRHWVVRTPEGQFVVCEAKDFEADYELVEEE